MKKRITIAIILIIILATSIFSLHVYSEAKKDMWYIYSIALDSTIDIDSALNVGMEYIAIDSSSLKDMSPKDRDRIINYFENKYNVDVVIASYNELKDQGLVKEGNLIDGILLSVKDVKIVLWNVHLEVSKYRSGLGAIGVKTTVTYSGINTWKITKSKMIWIS